MEVSVTLFRVLLGVFLGGLSYGVRGMEGVVTFIMATVLGILTAAVLRIVIRNRN